MLFSIPRDLQFKLAKRDLRHRDSRAYTASLAAYEERVYAIIGSDYSSAASLKCFRNMQVSIRRKASFKLLQSSRVRFGKVSHAHADHECLSSAASATFIADETLHNQDVPAILSTPTKATENAHSTGSMSLRRLASNRPALQGRVVLPPAMEFFSSSNSSSSTTPSSTSTGPTSSAPSISPSLFSRISQVPSTDIPATPVDQIIHTPLSPPTNVPAHTCKPKRKLHLDTVKPAQSSHSLGFGSLASSSPYQPFTPLEAPSLDGTNGVSTPDATQLLQKLKDLTLSHNETTSKPPFISRPAVYKTPHKLPSNLPRRLSYKRNISVSATSSPLSPRVRGICVLASPAAIQSPAREKVIHACSSPGYFSL
ncbi:hypothetical protein K474DRAFT_1774748 [Panus rudis PR-1116 ss-1]|nr:hypothetical protein K474DRAFT_1774748 [Panus rudis PR-1116 ss-1]